MSENKVPELKLIIVLYLLIAHNKSKPKIHSESDYSILVKRKSGGGVDPIKGFLAFLTDIMRVSISHQVLRNGQ